MKLKKWQKVGLIWALWMFAFMNIAFPLIKGEEITFKQIAIGIPIWLLGGLIFGYLMRKKYSEEN